MAPHGGGVTAAAGLILFFGVTWSGSARAEADEAGHVVVMPVDPQGSVNPPHVDVVVEAPGQLGSDAVQAASVGGRCVYEPEPQWESFFREIPMGLPAPSAHSDLIDPHAHLFSVVCNGVSQGFVWLGGSAGRPARSPTPAELARRAATELTLPRPVPRHSPDLRLSSGERAVMVGEHVWMWVDRAGFVPQTRRVQAGDVWAVVTATPFGVAFDPGDGHPGVVCDGPGTPFTPGSSGVHASSPDCGYLYSRSSFGSPGGFVVARYATRWRVTWTGSTGTAPAQGELPELRSTATVSVAVVEAQALATGR